MTANETLHLILEYDQRLGFYHWEKKRKQKLVVEVKLFFKTRKTTRADHLRDTVDYDDIDTLIQKTLKKRHYNLIETLSIDIAQALLTKWPLKGVEVTVDKPLALPNARKVSFTICRKKG